MSEVGLCQEGKGGSGVCADLAGGVCTAHSCTVCKPGAGPGSTQWHWVLIEQG
jgi:hypothetical protein